MTIFLIITVVYLYMMSEPALQAVAPFLCGGLAIMAIVLSDKTSNDVKHIGAAVMVFLMLLFSYVPPLRSALTAALGNPEEQGEEYEADETPRLLARPESQQGILVRVPADGDGHFRVTADIAGQRIRMMVDTGASNLVLSSEDARRLRVDVGKLQYLQPVKTANGVTHVAPMTLFGVGVGRITIGRVEAFVARPGELDESLLGMSFLRQLTRYELDRKELVLFQQRRG